MDASMKKIIIFSAPSGSGKSTIINYLLGRFPRLEFSISATSRQPRGEEKDGVHYYFFSAEEFRKRIDNGELLEWEEVYNGTYYGTLNSEIQRIWEHGNVIIFDVDVRGGIALKKIFGDQAMAMFIMPPSIEELRRRLIGRGTETEETIEKRIGKSEFELSFASQFDAIVVNDDLVKACTEAEVIITNFLEE